jgi:hypothetical protein
VKAFVDEIFDSSVMKGVSPSVRERVAKAEREFRAGSQRPIHESEFAEAVDRLVADYHLPGYMRTNPAQVRRFRQLMEQLTPSALSSTRRDEMTPAEATLMAVQLGTQKLFNPDYAVSPDEWIHSVDRPMSPQAELHGRGDARTRQPQLLTVPMSDDAVRVLQALDDPTPPELSDLSYGTHQFLDYLGIRR